MTPQTLTSLALAYPDEKAKALMDLARYYRKRNEQDILDVAAVVADVSADSLLSFGLRPEANASLLRAFRLQYPSVDIDSLRGMSGNKLVGFARGVKGKYFEVLVEEKLNNGERLGELALAKGQIARVADAATQPGWDLEILNSDGTLAEQIQLKATGSLSYIKEAFDKYPNIRIAATSEIDGTAEKILQTNISNEALEQTVSDHLGELSESAIHNTIENVADWALDAIPLVPSVVIVVSEGGAYLTGRSNMEDALHRSARRLKKASVFTALGATLNALDAGIISVPVTVAAQIAWLRMLNRIEMGQLLQQRTKALLLAAS